MSTPARYKKTTRNPTFQQIRYRISHKCLTCFFSAGDHFMLILGPILIVLACAIIVGLTYAFFWIILPMLAGTNWVTTNADWGEYWKERGYEVYDIDNMDEKISRFHLIMLAVSTPQGIVHTGLVFFFLVNINYNYYKCVATSNVGKNYAVVVRELAEATGFEYPETEEEMTVCKNKLDKSVFNKLERRKREIMAAAAASDANTNASVASVTNGNSPNGDVESQQTNSPAATTTTPQNNGSGNNAKMKPVRIPKIHNWQLLSPTEWSWCRHSKQPKPPRSHYDHVTKSLVLNMDHYCPWMFNVIGYFNYRYFFNFLCFVTIALIYGVIICYPAFRNLSGRHYKEQIRQAGELAKTAMKVMAVKHLRSNSYIPTPMEKTPVAFAFMMCLAVGIAVLCLASFHMHLVLSALTTIEFHGSVGKRLRGDFKNPYSTGNWKSNFEMIYGSGVRRHGVFGILLAMMPSNREPEYLPIPLDGKLVRRKKRGGDLLLLDKKDDLEVGISRDQSALTSVGLDDSESSGLKERVSRRSSPPGEVII